MPRTNDKRQRIMAAAERLFISGGLEQITLDQVAAEAHVGKGTLYLYFRDKEDLFFQTAMAGVDDLCALIRQEVPPRGNPRPFQEQLLLACHQINRFYARRKPLLRLFIAEAEQLSASGRGLRRRGLAKRRKLSAVLAEVLEQGVTEGRVRRDVPPTVLASFLLGMLRTQARDLEDRPARDRRDELVVDLFVNGVVTRR